MGTRKDTTKQSKFDFELMKSAATSDSPVVRKKSFIEYFERFEEFPTYLFDNETKIDEKLFKTIQDLLNDPETSKTMRGGLDAILKRLPS